MNKYCLWLSALVVLLTSYVTGYANRGLIRVINIKKSRFKILTTMYLKNAWCLVYKLLHQSIAIQGNSAGALFDGLLAELPTF